MIIMLKIIAAIIVGFAVWATPKAIIWAKDMREYDAIGGEYLLIPLAVLIAAEMFSISKTWRDFWPAETEVVCGEEVDAEDGTKGDF